MRRLVHHPLIPLLLLFVSFRVLALLLFRPGGFIADFSDFDHYRVWGQLEAAGYAVYDNLWSVYPPLFSGLMNWAFWLSVAVPPWADPRLSFHIVFGLILLLFETGNLILIYRLAGRLGDSAPQSTLSPLHPAILYALLFTPAYTLLGWFESLPLFFMLLGLELLLAGKERGWGWMASAAAAGLGFLVKLTPILLLPLAVRRLGSRLSWQAARGEWFTPGHRGNLLRPVLYTLIFAATVVAVALPFVWRNPALAFSSLRVQSIRPPWQSIWALLDGYYGYGLVPLDVRNLPGLDGPLWESSLPWGVITLIFVGVYLWLYTRPYDWRQPRTLVAFAGVSVLWLFLYSKGWSPQFLVWVLAFLVLLLPNLRGIVIAIALMVSNFIESHVYLIMLPDERWLLWGTVLLRTALLLLLAADFLGQIWPTTRQEAVARWSARLSWAVLAVGVFASLTAAPIAARAYTASRLAAHPCREAVELLRAEAEWPERLIVTEEPDLWEQFYPWLHRDYRLRILDGYEPDREPAFVASERLARLAESSPGFWFLNRAGGTGLADPFFEQPGVSVVSEEMLGDCYLRRVWAGGAQPAAVAQVTGGPIHLLGVQMEPEQSGDAAHLVIYWQAQQPVLQSYTVFVHLLDSTGRLVAQQDNLPVQGLAPTDTWQAGAVIRDPYRLALPPETPPGQYQIVVGLYTAEGRVSIQSGSGEPGESFALPLTLVQP